MTLTTIKKAGLDEIALDHVYTIGASGTSAYTFQGEGLNGTVNNPTLYLVRGKTYRFENGSGGHPFRIQSTSGQSGTAYNTGVTNNNTVGTVIVEVQHDAPDVLYYQCTSHAAMNGILYTVGALADGGVTEAKIAAGAVTNTKIAQNAVGTTSIAADAITNALIADNAVENANIANNAISTAKIADDAVNSAKIADNSIVAGNIAADAIGASELGNLSVFTGAIQDAAVTQAKLGNEAVNEAKLQVSNAPTNGYFLSAQSGNTGGLTWAQVAQPDLTNLSASNLTSGTIPDARFPSTLPAAAASNLTNLVAANLTGALPAIDGSSLTGIASNCTGCKVAIQSGEYNSMHNSAVQVPGTVVTFNNTVSEHKYMVLCGYTVKSAYSNNAGYRVETYLSGGNNMRWVHGNTPTGTSYTSMTSHYYTTYGGFLGLDFGSGTGTKTFSIYCRAYNNNGNSRIKDSYVMVMQFKTS